MKALPGVDSSPCVKYVGKRVDSPEYSYEELVEMAKLAKEKHKEQQKEVVTLRLQHKTVERAKAVGKGYTSFLSRLIEDAINDKDMVARSL